MKSPTGSIAAGMLLALLLGASPAALAAVSAEDAAAQEAAIKIATQVCSSCHGGKGVSVSPQFPNLAGQQKDYLVAQLRAFRGHTRAEPDAHDYMWGMATLVDERLVEPLSSYYASQTPAPGKPADPELMRRGEDLFRNGLPERQIVACAGCHGSDAAGQSVFPRLAGQHAQYLVKQLQAIQSTLRDSPVMHGIIRELHPDEMSALASWLQSR